MSVVVKAIIAEYLSLFFKNYDKHKLSYSLVLNGATADLDNMEFDENVLSWALKLPPALKITSAYCSHINLKIPLNLGQKSVAIALDFVDVEVVETEEIVHVPEPIRLTKLLKKLESKRRGIASKIIDGVSLSIKQFNFRIRTMNPATPALTITLLNTTITTTNRRWEVVPLKHAHIFSKNKTEIIVFRVIKCDFLCIYLVSPHHKTVFIDHVPMRIRLSLKKKTARNDRIALRAEIQLGSIVLALKQEEFAAALLLLRDFQRATSRTIETEEVVRPSHSQAAAAAVAVDNNNTEDDTDEASISEYGATDDWAEMEKAMVTEDDNDNDGGKNEGGFFSEDEDITVTSVTVKLRSFSCYFLEGDLEPRKFLRNPVQHKDQKTMGLNMPSLKDSLALLTLERIQLRFQTSLQTVQEEMLEEMNLSWELGSADLSYATDAAVSTTEYETLISWLPPSKTPLASASKAAKDAAVLASNAQLLSGNLLTRYASSIRTFQNELSLEVAGLRFVYNRAAFQRLYHFLGLERMFVEPRSSSVTEGKPESSTWSIHGKLSDTTIILPSGAGSREALRLCIGDLNLFYASSSEQADPTGRKRMLTPMTETRLPHNADSLFVQSIFPGAPSDFSSDLGDHNYSLLKPKELRTGSVLLDLDVYELLIELAPRPGDAFASLASADKLRVTSRITPNSSLRPVLETIITGDIVSGTIEESSIPFLSRLVEEKILWPKEDGANVEGEPTQERQENENPREDETSSAASSSSSSVRSYLIMASLRKGKLRIVDDALGKVAIAELMVEKLAILHECHRSGLRVIKSTVGSITIVDPRQPDIPPLVAVTANHPVGPHAISPHALSMMKAFADTDGGVWSAGIRLAYGNAIPEVKLLVRGASVCPLPSLLAELPLMLLKMKPPQLEMATSTPILLDEDTTNNGSIALDIDIFLSGCIVLLLDEAGVHLPLDIEAVHFSHLARPQQGAMMQLALYGIRVDNCKAFGLDLTLTRVRDHAQAAWGTDLQTSINLRDLGASGPPMSLATRLIDSQSSIFAAVQKQWSGGAAAGDTSVAPTSPFPPAALRLPSPTAMLPTVESALLSDAESQELREKIAALQEMVALLTTERRLQQGKHHAALQAEQTRSSELQHKVRELQQRLAHRDTSVLQVIPTMDLMRKYKELDRHFPEEHTPPLMRPTAAPAHNPDLWVKNSATQTNSKEKEEKVKKMKET